jgi:sugar phosphate isomerase/epimerase
MDNHPALPPLQAYLHYFNYRWRRRGEQKFDLHDLIDETANYGFSGLNLSVKISPNLFLESHDSTYLAEIRAHLEERNLGIDTETNGTDSEELKRELNISYQLGAEYFRTYTLPLADGRDRIEAAIEGLSTVAPLAEEMGITLLLENHEDITATQVAGVLDRVDHPDVKALFDYGNSAIFMEEPEESVRVLGEYSRSAHLKDHVTIPADGVEFTEPRWLGVPLGEGNLPIVETTLELQRAGLTRVCFENCWAYDTTFRDRRGKGELGQGVYQFREPPYDPQICLPDSGNSENVAEINMPKMEESVMKDSVRWLERAFREAKIFLERPLCVPA